MRVKKWSRPASTVKREAVRRANGAHRKGSRSMNVQDELIPEQEGHRGHFVAPLR